MQILGGFFKGRQKKDLTPSRSSLRNQVASMVYTYIAIRGLQSLLNPKTAIVMRRNYETFLTQDVASIDNRDSVIAVVYLKDTGYFDQFKTIQSNDSFRGGALAPTELDGLARQIATQLLNVKIT